MSFSWLESVANAAQPPAAVLGIAICAYLVIVALAAVVASLHPEGARREDARKVLDLLLKAARPPRDRKR